VGGQGKDSSGDIFLSFSTGNNIKVGSPAYPSSAPVIENIQMAHNDSMVTSSQRNSELESLFSAVADCVEEAIYNALCSAETVESRKGRKVEAIDLGLLKKTLEKHVVFEYK